MTSRAPGAGDASNAAQGARGGAGIAIPASADEPRVLMLTPDQAVTEIERLLRQVGMTRDELEAQAAAWLLDADQRGALQDIRGLEWLLARAGIPANNWRDAPANRPGVEPDFGHKEERDMSDEETLRDRLARIIYEQQSRRLGLRCAWEDRSDKSRYLDEADAIIAAPGIAVTELPGLKWSSEGRYYGYDSYVCADTTTGRVWAGDRDMEPSEAIDLAAALLAAANKANEGRA